MNNSFFKSVSLVSALSLGLLVGGCSSSDSDDSVTVATISGTAATGAATAGNVEAVGSEGNKSDMAVIGADGTFSVDVSALIKPFMLKSIAADSSELYSFAAAAGTVNITQLTDLAVRLSNTDPKLPAKDLYDSWKDDYALLTADKVESAQKTIFANFKTQFEAAGIAAVNYKDFMTKSFATDETGLDKVLDQVTITNGSDGSPQVSIDGSTLSDFLVSIDLSEIDFSTVVGGGGVAAGEWTLAVTTLVGGQSTGVPVEFTGVPAPENIAAVQTQVEASLDSSATDVTITAGVDTEDLKEFSISYVTSGITINVKYTYTRA